jgi:drug/metabolite transporter (DMT)-like permease
MFYVYPVLVSVGAALLYREDFGRRQALVLALGLGGVALTVGRPGSVPWIGIGLGLLAAVCTTGYFLGGRYAMSRDVDPLSITTLLYLTPSLVLVAIALVRGFHWPSMGAAGFASGVTVAGTVVPILMLFAAIRTIGAAPTALLSTIEPFLAVVFAYAFLGERLTGLQLAGGALIVAAVVVSAAPPRARG